MTHRRTSLVLCVVALCAAARVALCAVPEGAVAVVNGDVLSRAEFRDALVRTLGWSAMETYIDWTLVEQEARRAGVTVSDAEVEARAKLEARIRRRRLAEEQERMSPQQAIGEIETALRPETLRVRLLAEKLLRPRVSIRDVELRECYERTHGGRFLAAQIALEDQQSARTLLGVLSVQPEAWPDAVLHYSLDRASVPYQGRMRPVPASSPLGEMLQGMAAGEMRIYGDNDRWHIVQLIRSIPPSGRSFEEVEEELREELYCQRVDEVIDSWLAGLNARATVVVNLSTDPRERGVLGSRTVAFVNGEGIRIEAFGDALVDLFGKRFIGPYVDRHLVFQHARRRGITVPREALDAAVAQAADRLFAEHAASEGMTAEQFALALERQMLSADDYKRELAKELVPVEDIRAELLAEQVLAGMIELTPEDVERTYKDMYGERIEVQRIVLDDTATAERILEAVRNGANFQLLVQAASVEPMAWMHKGIVPDVTALHPYYRRVERLSVGACTNAFDSEGRYIILKVLGKHPATAPPALDSVREEVTRLARARKARTRIAAWLEKLRAESEIEIEL